MNAVFNIQSKQEFENLSLAMFRKQYDFVPVYHDFVKYLGIDPLKVTEIEQIPFLPVELFKSHKIIDSRMEEKTVFYSSGTTASSRSRHFIADTGLYEYSFTKTFSHFYDSPSNYCILALLPSYLGREGSSLVYMVDKLIKLSGDRESGFYLSEFDKLMKNILRLKNSGRKIIVLGVSFALLDLAEKFNEDLSGVIFMETGGMKGRRKEITRAELHHILKKRFNLPSIHSEYGMTELLSQAYSSGEGHFFSPSWMKILIRDSHDPLQIMPAGKTGNINIIDLANMNSCSFLSTSDIGKINPDNSFEVLGRTDNSDIRGCNLLIDNGH